VTTTSRRQQDDKVTTTSRRQQDDKVTTTSRRQKDKVTTTKTNSKNQRKTADSEDSDNYFQVEISNRHSGGSDKYSVIGEKDGGDTTTVSDQKDNTGDYNIIDMTGLVPRSVNCSPLSLHTFLAGPDLIRDLPAAPGRKVGRSISFLSHSEYQRMRRPEKHLVMKASERMNPQSGQADRLTSKPVTVKRSLSAVIERYRPQQR
jgi:hypothetical protein